ncbi:MAG: RnfABCDGE type electron transport complex subunit G [Paludibacter sp.]
MKKLESDFKNMVFVLSTIALFAALVLSTLFSITKEPIARSKNAKEQNAIKDVLPPYHHFDRVPIVATEGVETMKVYKAYNKNNVLVGAAVETTSNNGFSGPIDIMIGFDTAGVILNYKVLEQHETPGLGAKMGDWFKTNNKKQSIIGKNAGTSNLSVSKSGGEVDAITSATISSNAFLFAVRNAYFVYCKNTKKLHCDTISSKKNYRKYLKDAESVGIHSEKKGENK